MIKLSCEKMTEQLHNYNLAFLIKFGKNIFFCCNFNVSCLIDPSEKVSSRKTIQPIVNLGCFENPL